MLFKEARGVLGLQEAVLKKLNNFFLEMSERSRKQKVKLNTVWGDTSWAYVALWNLGPHFSPPEQCPLLCPKSLLDVNSEVHTENFRLRGRS